MFKFVMTIFNDCAKGRSGKYAFDRVGAILGGTYLITMETAQFYFTHEFDMLIFATALGSLIGLVTTGVGARHLMEGKGKQYEQNNS